MLFYFAFELNSQIFVGALFVLVSQKHVYFYTISPNDLVQKSVG